MTTKKVIQANYSGTLVAVLISDYQALIASHNGDNSTVLKLLSEKHGKTIPSLRAKLASLKVYKKSADTSTSTSTSSVPSKITKEQIAVSISKLVGQPLDGLEVAPKAVLLAIAEKLLEQKDKINDLISDLTSEDNQA